MDSYKSSRRSSFTLIEILIVLAIIGIISSIGIAKYNTYTQQLVLKNQAKKIVQVIELAKKKSVSGDLYQDCIDFQGYRVIIGSDNLSLLFNCGGVYSTVQNYSMTSNISTITGTGNFDFLPLGAGNNLTINSIRIKNSKINQCIDIFISSIGIINITDTLISC
jgi:prepilin-type N-terminal cleavage/methylation domain-containing protein